MGFIVLVFQILSRYDIVLVQEIRDSSETYIYRLVDEANNSTYVRVLCFPDVYMTDLGPRYIYLVIQKCTECLGRRLVRLAGITCI